jgi:hypothetical protein
MKIQDLIKILESNDIRITFDSYYSSQRFPKGDIEYLKEVVSFYQGSKNELTFYQDNWKPNYFVASSYLKVTI